MKFFVYLLATLACALLVSCARGPGVSSSVSPGALAQGEECCCPCDDCPGGVADCTMTCEELPNGQCRVTCTVDGDECCSFVCDPVECDEPCPDGLRIECDREGRTAESEAKCESACPPQSRPLSPF